MVLIPACVLRLSLRPCAICMYHPSAMERLKACAIPVLHTVIPPARALHYTRITTVSRPTRLRAVKATSAATRSHVQAKRAQLPKQPSSEQAKGEQPSAKLIPPPNCIDDAAAVRTGVARVVLKRGKARLFRDGSPMVYGGAVDRVIGRPPPSTGDPVTLSTSTGETIAWGIFNPDSMFRVRLIQSVADATAHPEQVLNVAAVITDRIADAVTARRQLMLPSAGTTVYRLINSEGDRLSGLVVDVLGTTLVVSSSSAFIELNRTVITKLLRSATEAEHLIWRPSTAMLREEGLPDDLSQPPQMENDSAEVPNKVELVENGMKFFASPFGQKTGFYADQRDSRQIIRQLAAGKRVLDLCTYSGGFAISAALGGASSAMGVDTSAPALELARANAELNSISSEVCSFRQADIMDVMKEELAANSFYDLIVLDPPKLAPNRKSMQRALSRYRALNSAAMRLLPPGGGLLMTCSCSGAVTQNDEFLPMLQKAAAVAGRHITVLRRASAAADHPLDAAYPEGAYLSNVLLRVL